MLKNKERSSVRGSSLIRKLLAVTLALAITVMFTPAIAYENASADDSSAYTCSQTEGWGVDFNKLDWTNGTDTNIFGSGSNWNAMVFGDNADLIDSEGPIAVQGNFTESATGTSIGLTYHQSMDSTTLLVGGNISLTGNAANGYIKVAGHTAVVGSNNTASGENTITKSSDTSQLAKLKKLYNTPTTGYDSGVNDNGSSYLVRLGNHGIKADSTKVSNYFSSAKTYLTSLQSKLSGYSSNGKISVDKAGNNITLTQTSDTLNVFSIDKSTVDSLDGYSITINTNGHSSDATNIVNISGFDTINSSGFNWGNKTIQQKTIFNITGTSKMTVSGFAIYGSILAPNTDCAASGGNFNGNSFIKSMKASGGFEYHWYKFTGSVPAKGSITVTKEVKGITASDAASKDYYVTLFSDKDCKNAVATKTITVSGSGSGTATFSGLDLGKTYYAAETDSSGNVITANDTSSLKTAGYTFDAAKSTLGAVKIELASTSGATGSATITNTYEQNKGSLTITKKVSGAGDVTKTFYAGVFSDAECTKLVGSAHAIAVTGGTSKSVTVSDLPAGHTYYVAETDKDGKVLSTTSTELAITGYELQTINYSDSTQKVVLADKNNATGSKTITNTYIKKNIKGSIKVTKTIKGIASADLTGKDGTITVNLYQGDKAEGTPYATKTITIKDGVATNTVLFDNLSPGNYIIEEDTTSAAGLGDYGLEKTSIDDLGKVTVEASKEKTVGIENTYTKKVGSICVIKSVQGFERGESVDKTFYVSLFSDSKGENQVGETKVITIKDAYYPGPTTATSKTVEFTNLTAGKTYYVAETDSRGNVITADDHASVDIEGYTFDLDNSGIGLQKVELADTNGASEFKVINNIYTKNKGSLSITKTVAGAGNVTKTFYAGVFTNENCEKSSMVGDARAIAVTNGTSATIKVTGLDANKTYYVAETDASGNVLTTSSTDLTINGYSLQSISYSGGTRAVKLADSADAAGTKSITNTYSENPKFGSISVTKVVTIAGDTSVVTPISGTFYVSLYSDAACTQKVSGTTTQAITVTDGVAMNTANFTSLTPGTYYVAETDATGSTVYTSAPAITGYTSGSITNNMSAASVSAGSTSAVTVTNDYTITTPPVTPPNDPKTPTTPTSDTAVTTSVTPADASAATGDSWNGGLWMILLLIGAAGVITPIAIRRRRED